MRNKFNSEIIIKNFEYCLKFVPDGVKYSITFLFGLSVVLKINDTQFVLFVLSIGT